MAARRVRQWGIALAVVVPVAVLLLALGAFQERDEPAVPTVAAGQRMHLDLAEVVVERVDASSSTVTVTMTVTNRLSVPLQVLDLVRVVDDEGELATFGSTTVGELFASAAQPGVTETFTTVYEPERAAVGPVLVEVIDGRWVERDETAFGIGANIYDQRVVARVEAS